MKVNIINCKNLDNKKYYIKVFDNKELILEKYVSNSFNIVLKDGVYKIYVFYCSNIIYKGVFYKKSNLDFINIYINNISYRRIIITDYNYPGLLLERGNLILWPVI